MGGGDRVAGGVGHLRAPRPRAGVADCTVHHEASLPRLLVAHSAGHVPPESQAWQADCRGPGLAPRHRGWHALLGGLLAASSYGFVFAIVLKC